MVRGRKRGNKDLYKSYQQSWEMTDGGVSDLLSLDLDSEWARMESVIAENSNNKSRVIYHEQFTKKRNFNFTYKIAAAILILLIPVGFAYFYFSQSENRIIAQGNILNESLPDGSGISLFRNSTIIYSNNYNKKIREVKLSGEAFFNVKPDKDVPFLVNAGEVIIKVLGTSFNVKSPIKGDEIEVIVETGKVLVYTNADKMQKVELTPGERAIYNKRENKLVEKLEIDPNFSSWRTRKLKFRDKKFSYVIRMLNKVYGANIIIEDSILKKCRVAIDFENQPLEEVLEVLQGIINFEIGKKDSKIIISGSGC